jgi:hypothetical protein
MEVEILYLYWQVLYSVNNLEQFSYTCLKFNADWVSLSIHNKTDLIYAGLKILVHAVG